MSKIHYILLLDASPSMYSFMTPTIQGANQVIASLKNTAKEHSANIDLSVVAFARDIKSFADGVSIKNAKPITTLDGVGSGTALYESLCATLESIKPRVKKNDKVVINIFTDGQDNSETYMRDMEKKYNAEICAKMCKDAIGTGKYTIAFVAANQDARAVAKSLHIPETNAMDYQQSHSGTRAAFWLLAKAARQYVEDVVENWNGNFAEDFFPEVDLKNTTLKVKDIEVTVNMPESLSSDDEDGSNELPPYAPVSAYVVDEYPACPDNWEHGSAKASSYFIPVKTNHGCWFDFNKLSSHEHDMAVVVSVQGVNPINGQKTSELCLEKYENKCPLHDEEFGQERFCDKCGFKWPAQNYLATTAQPHGNMWLDGFRAKDGKVRQYIFTAEEMKGVAFHVLGDKDKPKEQHARVHAVGFAFYRSKEAKPKPVQFESLTRGIVGASGFSGYSGTSGYSGASGFSGVDSSVSPPTFFSPIHTPQNWQAPKTVYSQNRIGDLFNITDDQDKNQVISQSLDTDDGRQQLTNSMVEPVRNSKEYPDVIDGVVDQTMYTTGPKLTKKRARMKQASVDRYYTFNGSADAAAVRATLQPKNYEVAAGARIDQRVHEDPQKMNYWEEEPYGFIYVNYTDEATAQQILSAGKRKEVEEGFLAEVPVGN